ncbi:hypothetical protein BX659_14513 [Orenia metallireducens]|uniref:Bacteriocin-type signal sequence-containing protein n=1 Tax=Orenia metallireducens TaxID=1413210 RepID=A0A285IIK7_9FIRM|nr:hypothetical protein [Orenia metallireducens]PRX18137.1 hypothetical protein BX659_14513 [Orenia metallireducens]SNY46916.1 hypothetical protein SAMN06265827_14613 [Orenia metallireducens]
MAKNKQTELSLEELEEITGGFNKVSKDISSNKSIPLSRYGVMMPDMPLSRYGVMLPDSDWTERIKDLLG